MLIVNCRGPEESRSSCSEDWNVQRYTRSLPTKGVSGTVHGGLRAQLQIYILHSTCMKISVCDGRFPNAKFYSLAYYRMVWRLAHTKSWLALRMAAGPKPCPLMGCMYPQHQHTDPKKQLPPGAASSPSAEIIGTTSNVITRELTTFCAYFWVLHTFANLSLKPSSTYVRVK